MKKKAKFISLIALLLLSTLILTACNFDLSNLIIDHEFSEDGVKEINDFYKGTKEADTDYAVVYKVDIDQEPTVTIKWSRKKNTDSEEMMYCIRISGDDFHYRLLKLGDEADLIYINEKTHEYTTDTESAEIGSIKFYNEIILSLCIIDMEDNEGVPIWGFVEKKEDVTIQFQGKDLKTVEYEYKDSDNTKLKVSFDSKSFLGVLAIIRKIEYTTTDNSVTTIYIDEPSAKVIETDFAAPKSPGYTSLEE